MVYVHASGNSGRGDEHLGLGDGTLDWRHVLDMLDLSRILEIILNP
jgi:sugar phosphate isomerase/epimerase